jgi:hypothetical protein
VLNALAYFGDAAGAGGIQSVQPGQAVALRAAGAGGALAVRTPGGKSISLALAPGETGQFAATDELGVYTIEESGEPPRHFAVNLFDSMESNIPPRDSVEIGHDEIAGTAVWEGGRVELWKLLLVGVLGILCLEWYIYNRRVHV